VCRYFELSKKHRTSSTSFTCKRKLPFYLLICFIINLVKGFFQAELDRFFQAELDRFFQAITHSRMAKSYYFKEEGVPLKSQNTPEFWPAACDFGKVGLT